MFQFFILGVFMCQAVLCQVDGRFVEVTHPHVPQHPGAQHPGPAPVTETSVDKPKPCDSNGQTYNAGHQTFYVNGPLTIACPSSSESSGSPSGSSGGASGGGGSSGSSGGGGSGGAGGSGGSGGGHGGCGTDGKQIRDDYKVTKGIGAHKVHNRKFTWNRARRVCHEEGGHLAIIRSEAEERVVQELMLKASVEGAWVGFHDQYEEGDWVTVLDEPLAAVEWEPWAKNLGHANPDNFEGRQNCAWYVRDSSGIDDNFCDHENPFVCKISIT